MSSYRIGPPSLDSYFQTYQDLIRMSANEGRGRNLADVIIGTVLGEPGALESCDRDLLVVDRRKRHDNQDK